MQPTRFASFVLLAAIVAALGICATTPVQGAGAAVSRDTLLAAAREMMIQARICSFVTIDAAGFPHARAMDAFPPDGGMVVRMGTARHTRKVAEILKNPKVALYYAHPKGYGYVSLYGTARISDDPAETTKWWKEEWARFYPQKKGFVVIEVTPARLEIVDYSRGLAGDTLSWVPPSVEF